MDIETARYLGAKIISIATGSNSYEELKQHKLDLHINSFSELDLELFK